jgi:hypothetical protein
VTALKEPPSWDGECLVHRGIGCPCGGDGWERGMRNAATFLDRRAMELQQAGKSEAARLMWRAVGALLAGSVAERTTGLEPACGAPVRGTGICCVLPAGHPQPDDHSVWYGPK